MPEVPPGCLPIRFSPTLDTQIHNYSLSRFGAYTFDSLEPFPHRPMRLPLQVPRRVATKAAEAPWRRRRLTSYQRAEKFAFAFPQQNRIRATMHPRGLPHG